MNDDSAPSTGGYGRGGFGAGTAVAPRYRRVGLRMSCWSCEVAWTGAVESTCWVCDGPGVPGPPPSIYPDID